MTRSRRDFLKASAAVAAGTMAATNSLSAAPGLITRVTPFGVLDAATPFDDPAVKALMQVALDTAKSGGASYADVRVAARRQQNVSTRDRIVQGVNDTDTFGLGVRTLVDGAWGFAATSMLSKDSVADVARKALALAMGALKYFILKVDPKKKMLFNPKESIDFTGHTGPFIQYTYARIKSVIRKNESAVSVSVASLSAATALGAVFLMAMVLAVMVLVTVFSIDTFDP